MRLPRVTGSLLLTGVADVWSAAREEVRGRGEAGGLVLMVVAAGSFALMAAFAKKLLPHAPTQALVFSRGVMMSAIFLLLARRRGAPVLGRRPWLLLGRGLLGYAALSCYFYSVQHLPLGDAVLLQYSHPVFVAALAPLVMGERLPKGDFSLILLALAGVGLIVGPSGEARPEALVGLCGSLLSGLAYMTVRSLAKSESSLTILVWFPLATLPPSLAFVLWAGRAALPASGWEVLGHLLVTLAALVGQVTLTLGLKRASVTRATGVTLSGPVFGLLLGYLFFATVPGWASLAGTAVVLVALGLLGYRTALRARPANGAEGS